jgi:glycosyltransferase involved in cell wall biosynthesis
MTGIVVTYNTYELFHRCYTSIRKHLPNIELIIVDGSSESDPCFQYVRELRHDNQIFQLRENIGHGRGLHYGLQKCKTKTALIFDSDIVLLKSPVSDMLARLDHDTYAVGWRYEIGRDGFDFGTPGRGHIDRIPYIHPYFMLLNVEQYFKYAPFCHHGAPGYKWAVELYVKGLSWMLKSYPGLTGHTNGQGINWKGKPSIYVQHDFGGTRTHNKELYGKEIPGKWDR